MAIFNNKLIPPKVISALVIHWAREYKVQEKEPKVKVLVPPEINKGIPWAYFDGGSQGDPPLGGSGGVLYLSRFHKIQAKFSPGHCTNNKAELATLHMVLELAIKNNISQLQVFGDSKMVVDWVNKKIQINAPNLQQLLNAIRRLLESFSNLMISHIYRDLNTEAVRLSKLALLPEPGKLETEENLEN